MKNITDEHIRTIAQTLVGHLLNADKKKDELRDISAIGLKTVFNEINYSDPSTKGIIENLSTQLAKGIVDDVSACTLHDSYRAAFARVV